MGRSRRGLFLACGRSPHHQNAQGLLPLTPGKHLLDLFLNVRAVLHIALRSSCYIRTDFQHMLLGSYGDMWYLAGGEICAAPEDAFDDFDLPLKEGTVNLGETTATARTAKTNISFLFILYPPRLINPRKNSAR